VVDVDAPDPDASGEETGPPKGPVTIEQPFKIDGEKLDVLVKFPAQVSEEIGMDNLLVAANRAIVTVDTDNHDIEKIRRRDMGP
jgi:hypothetical protein